MNQKKKILIIFFIAIILRLGFIFIFPQEKILYADSKSYDTIAKNLVRGYGFSINPNVPTVTRPPLYPFFLSIIYYFFGQNYQIIRIFQVIIGSISCIILFYIARTFNNEKISMISAIICAIYPVFIVYCGLILTETLFTFLLLSSILFIIKAINEQDTKYFLISGFLLGITTLCRATTIFLPLLILLIFYLLKIKNFIKKSLLFIFFFLLILFPWTYRNYNTFGVVIPVSTIPKLWVYVSGHLSAGGTVETGLNKCSEWAKDYPEPIIFKKGQYPRLKFDEELNKEGLKLIKNNFKNYILLVLKRPFNFWISSHSSVFGVDRSISYYLLNKNYLDLFVRFGMLFLNGFIVILAFYILIMLTIDSWKVTLIFIGIFLYFNNHIIIDPCPRYLLPVLPLVFIFFSDGIVKIINKFKI